MIRQLVINDDYYMYEWMHDYNVTSFFDTDFSLKTLQDCRVFISNSCTRNNKHFAIVNDSNDYMGTVSLKNIDYNKKIAEMAIVLRKCAMGKGYSKKAIEELFDYGRKELGLKLFYWYVNPNNKRLLNFMININIKK